MFPHWKLIPVSSYCIRNIIRYSHRSSGLNLNRKHCRKQAKNLDLLNLKEPNFLDWGCNFLDLISLTSYLEKGNKI